jgi:hypothetical protein
MSEGDDEELQHLQNAIEVYKKEKTETRALIKAGDASITTWVTRANYLAALLAIIAAIGPLFWVDIAVAVIGVLAGVSAAIGVYLQTRWATRRTLLDERASHLDDDMQKVELAAAEIDTQRRLAGAELRQLAVPARKRRKRRRRGRGGRGKNPRTGAS